MSDKIIEIINGLLESMNPDEIAQFYRKGFELGLQPNSLVDTPDGKTRYSTLWTRAMLRTSRNIYKEV